MPLPDHVKIGGGTAEEGLRSLLHATYPGISNPQPRPPRDFAERIILTTRNETVDELNHSILAKFSRVTHTFAGYDEVVRETQERQGHYAEDVDAGYTLEYLQTDTEWLSKGKTRNQSRVPSDVVAQVGSFPMPLQWNEATDHSHFHTCP